MFMITKTTAHCSLIFFKYANRKINPNFLLHDYNLKKEVCALFVYCTEAELAPYISIPPASMEWEFIANKTYIRVTSKFD
jgi:hypothetical protein